jgi:ABC-type glycerol-3-phosphate transport system substrate-binding protein
VFDEDGKLYQTVGNFYILTTAGLSAVVGDRIGWNMDGFNAALQMLQAENPNCTVFDRYTTRDLALTFLLYLDLENYVDWNTGECRFDTEEFTRFLEFVKSFPTVFDWESDMGADDFDENTRMLMGLQLMKQCNFANFEDLQLNTVGLGDTPCTFIGYPTENGVGSMFAQIGNSIAITSACQDKEAAWQFVRQYFLPEYQEQFLGSVFPTNLSVYEKMKLEAMTPRYQRNPDGSYMLNAEGQRIEEDRGNMVINGVSYPYKTVTEEEIAVVEEIIAETGSILHTDRSLKEIIIEGAAPYFAGQRSVEEVAKLIQSKAMLYVNEQR